MAGGIGQLEAGDLLAVAVVVILLHLLALNVLYPKMLGSRLKLNPLAVTIALLFWGWIWGVPGLFLAMPLMAALKAVCEQVPGWQPWANLMSSREVDESPGPSAPTAVLAVAAHGADPDQTVLMEAQTALPKRRRAAD